MFELFTALFGGLYYGGKYLCEKANESSYDNRMKKIEYARENIKFKYVASMELENWAKDFILSGEHFDDICDWFADDFRYVFGENWKNELRIPPRPPVLNPKIYKKDAYSFSMPINHITWVYYLLLAKEGKIDSMIPTFGFPIGGINEKDMCIRFAERIERRLIDCGADDIRLALELDNITTDHRRTPDEVCGGDIKIESLCVYPTYRLWDDYIPD